MIVTPAVEQYLAGLHAGSDEVLAEMQEQGEREGIPIVQPETYALLHVLALATGALRVVEVGTAIGVSTLALARGVGDGGVVVSFEVDGARQAAARAYLERAGVADRVDLRLEPGIEGLARLEGPFDLAFLDAVKNEYGDYLSGVLPLLRPGALVVVDNVLMSGTVAENASDGHWSAESIAAARAFNERLLSHPDLTGTVTPVGDGVALAVRRF
jgi:predicted O-methyltransferase YrrM